MEDFKNFFSGACAIDSTSAQTENTKQKAGCPSIESTVDVLNSTLYLPERILFCVDSSSEMDKQTFKTRSGVTSTAMLLVKKAISYFIHTKSAINKDHTFSLCPLFDEAKLDSPPSFQPLSPKLLDCIGNLKADLATDSCDLNSLLQRLLLDLPTKSSPQTTAKSGAKSSNQQSPAAHVLRLVLIYGRSHTVPQIDNALISQLMKCPYFFMDVFYIHEKPNDTNKCHTIFDQFCKLDVRNTSYICEESTNVTQFYNQMAQLIAHPLQRPAQSQAHFKLAPIPIEDTKPILNLITT